jgi:hypothetical protein
MTSIFGSEYICGEFSSKIRAMKNKFRNALDGFDWKASSELLLLTHVQKRTWKGNRDRLFVHVLSSFKIKLS